MSEPISKNELLTLIEAEYERLEATLAPLTTHQLLQIGVTEEWSIKDVLAHLTFWQKHSLDELQKLLRHEPLPHLKIEGEDWAVTMDKINQQNFLANARLSLDEVRNDFETSYQQILELIREVEEAEFEPDSAFEKALGGEPLSVAIGSNTYEHYQEHINAIQNWLRIDNE